ncbi:MULTISPECIES: hypothetical protein [Mycobacteroides]|uniref:Uncharacterized protein n=1 Tax=Mycobacteroides franklinii TaxID=948102 RepID=A0A4R5PE39_9MYCO|nr:MULTISPECIES: hypothetical protein [Mycobacteroides]MBN7556044.1 hypothetical protein [Mycobacteroides abscessus subsp. abscessus]MDM2349074.1 hypothetical protein [Mycobacteroides abscessus]MDM2359909.1 hypothetical protein [Mycobacteroides abscessus]MDO3010114.1 hypothetical protein [Mycobacteroides abscessus subsp. abscessus]MDO3043125.1 hypothetical protein [Mycobacteroides abscessus subsp. abscessus]
MNEEQELEYFDAHVRHAERAEHIERQIEIWKSELGPTLAFLHVLNVLSEVREASRARCQREALAALGKDQ